MKLNLDAAIEIVGQARLKTVIAMEARPLLTLLLLLLLPTPTVIGVDASVKALAVVARMTISSAALSSIFDKDDVVVVQYVAATARFTIASKHAMEASANAINDVCC